MPCRPVLGVIALAILLGGCTSFKGNAFDGPPPADVATITMDMYIRLVSVDDKSVPGVPAEPPGDQLLRPRTVRVLPGEHRIVAGVGTKYLQQGHEVQPLPGMTPGGYTSLHKYHGSETDHELKFTAQPKHQYHIRLVNAPAHVDAPEQWFLELVDQSSGKFDDIVALSLRKVPHTTPPARD